MLKRRGNPSGETTGSARLAALREITDTRPAHADEAGLRTLLAELGPMRDVLAYADVEREARLYAELGITMTYRADDDVIVVEAPRVGRAVFLTITLT